MYQKLTATDLHNRFVNGDRTPGPGAKAGRPFVVINRISHPNPPGCKGLRKPELIEPTKQNVKIFKRSFLRRMLGE